MKKIHILPGAAFLMALALTACSNDLPNSSGPQVNEKDEIRYVRVSIANAPSTRADPAEFDKGTAAENKVSSAYFRFYDITGKPVGETATVNLEFKDTEGTPTPSVGQIATTVVQVSIPKGSTPPSYVVAFINPVDWDELDDDTNLYDLRDQKRDDYKSTSGDFAMNNAAYYGDDPLTVSSDVVKMMGAPILANQLYKSEEDANAEDASMVDIFIERYAAKVQFSFGAEGVTDLSKVVDDLEKGDFILRFIPEVWTVNADAPSMYATKRFENSDKDKDVIPSYQDVQDVLGNWTSWNDEPNHRSYWACSPGYYATESEFPAVSDNIIDIADKDEALTGDKAHGAGVAVAPYKLRYYSYNQIKDETLKSDGLGRPVVTGGTTTKYVLENTMGTAAFQSVNPKAAAPSVLLIGHYDLYTKDKANAITIGDGFCIYNDEVYWRNAVPEGITGETILKKLMDSNQILATDNEGTLMKFNEEFAGLFEVSHPSADVRGTMAIPHRYVTLQLKSDDSAADLKKLYYKPNGSDSWQPIITETTDPAQLKAAITSINKQLWAQLSNARAYTNGKCYFSIPIRHLGYTENTDGEPETDGVLDWAKVRVGDFGLVRNHVYSIQVSAIKGLASGIEDPANPLVPSMEDDNYWVKYRVNILNWRVVPAQSGIILK